MDVRKLLFTRYQLDLEIEHFDEILTVSYRATVHRFQSN